MVEMPETGVRPTATLNVPADETATFGTATDPSTEIETGEHGAGQKPTPRTVTCCPGVGWAGRTLIEGPEAMLTGTENPRNPKIPRNASMATSGAARARGRGRLD